jgi:2-polyprenyl-3-methyl-5-hydroxy-6-metoxy-1,4-benzoquinol methylase
VNLFRSLRSYWRAAKRRRRIVQTYRRLLGRRPDKRTLRHYTSLVADGAAWSEVLHDMVTSPEYVEKMAERVDKRADADDTTFVTTAYRQILQREPDHDGLCFYTTQLHGGVARRDLLNALITSDEHVNRVSADLFSLPNLRKRWPNHYVEARTKDGQTLLAFSVSAPEWLDRLETAILKSDYYEKPGIWEFSLNRDKRVMAELLAALEPRSVLEIGCSNGTVLQCLYRLGIDVTGLDISPSAVTRADPSVRDRIRVGDLLTTALPGEYEVVFGLDVFEHLNPNHLGDYLSAVQSLTSPGGFVFTNLPAYGDDPVFGTVFPLQLEEWERDAEADRPFGLLPVDHHGYPFHGHLIWATSTWWVDQFEQTGLRREAELEQALHERYDAYMRQNSPARRSFYIFSRDADRSLVREIIGRIRSGGSTVLKEEWQQAPAVTVTDATKQC